MEAEMGLMAVVARAVSTSALERAIVKTQEQELALQATQQAHSTPVIRIKDKHSLREQEGSQLWAKHRARMTPHTSAISAVQRPHSGLHTKATRLWSEELPAPVAKAAENFDQHFNSQKQRARLALKGLAEDPTSCHGAHRFGMTLQELRRKRYVVNAPVQHLAEAYPDGVWGITIDRLSPSKCYDVPRRFPRGGIEFSGIPQLGSAPVRPMLPALPGRRTHVHMILPDSHHALGAFRTGSDVQRKRYTKPAKPLPPAPRIVIKRSYVLERGGWDGSVAGVGYGPQRPGGPGGDWELLSLQHDAMHPSKAATAKAATRTTLQKKPLPASATSNASCRNTGSAWQGTPPGSNAESGGGGESHALSQSDLASSEGQSHSTAVTASASASQAHSEGSKIRGSRRDPGLGPGSSSIQGTNLDSNGPSFAGDIEHCSDFQGHIATSRAGAVRNGDVVFQNDSICTSTGKCSPGNKESCCSRDSHPMSNSSFSAANDGGASSCHCSGATISNSRAAVSSSGSDDGRCCGGAIIPSSGDGCRDGGSCRYALGACCAGCYPVAASSRCTADSSDVGSTTVASDSRGHKSGDVRIVCGQHVSNDDSRGACSSPDHPKAPAMVHVTGCHGARDHKACHAREQGVASSSSSQLLGPRFASVDLSATGSNDNPNIITATHMRGYPSERCDGSSHSSSGEEYASGCNVSRPCSQRLNVAIASCNSEGAGDSGEYKAASTSTHRLESAGEALEGTNVRVAASGDEINARSGCGETPSAGEVQQGRDARPAVHTTTTPTELSAQTSTTDAGEQSNGMDTEAAVRDAKDFLDAYGNRGCRGTPLQEDGLDASIWRARRHGPYPSDSADYIDTPKCTKKAFLSDWSATSGAAVVQNGMKGRSFGVAKMTKETINDIQDVLYESYPMLLRIFTYYSCVDAAISKCCYGISKSGYTLMLNDASLDLLDAIEGDARIPRHAKLRGEDGFDLLWVAVNSYAASKGASVKGQPKDRLSRGEFLEWLVRTAIDEQPLEECAANVQLLCEDLLEFLTISENGRTVFSNSNWFRMDTCYTHEVSAALDEHKASLHSLFSVYAASTGVGTSAQERDSLMNYTEFSLLWEDLGFTKELSERRIALAFALSSMLVIDESAKKSLQLERLSFEGFLEAFVRIADIKLLPTEVEISDAGHRYPGEFLVSILDSGVERYRSWGVRARSMHKTGASDPICRRIRHLILLIAYTMQAGVESSAGGKTSASRRSPDETLSIREVDLFRSKPSPGPLGDIDLPFD